MERLDCVVIGAGVIGLAVARALALAGREVLVLEAAGAIGTGISSRSSEVIHAGIYYPPGSLMARLSVAGRRALTRFCDEHGVAWARPGKLIVATDAAEAQLLGAIATRAQANGVEGLRLLSAADVRAEEPELACHGALLSPVTGIIDSAGYMLALRGAAEAAGAFFAFHAPVEGGQVRADGVELSVGGEAPMRLAARLVVNAAGLGAVPLARRIGGLDPALIPPLYLAKGSYFALSGRAPFRRLIYPVPVPGGLGVHLTLDLGGAARFGPDVEWVEAEDYVVDPARGARFAAAVRRYWPGLDAAALVPAYAGIRPKIVPQGAPAQDFLPVAVPGLVNLFGIESPGLTASLALADLVRDQAA